jgi:hypothetical protein
MPKTNVTKSRKLQERIGGISDSAYENFKKIVDDIEINGFQGAFRDSEDLEHVFHWSSSPQGADYWINISRALDEIKVSTLEKDVKVEHKKSKEYIIITNNTPEDLAILINEQMCEYDVEFVGGVSVTRIDGCSYNYTLYSQALLRSERE